MNLLGYEVGDKVYVFHRNGLHVGTVSKITPSGLIDVTRKADGTVTRFTARGKELGYQPDYNSRGVWLEKKSVQEIDAEQVRINARNNRVKMDYRVRLDELKGKDVHDPEARVGIITELRAIATFLEELK